MSLKEIQDEFDKWAQKCDPPYWKPHEIMARLIEEVGELAREINHRYGPKKKKSSEETKEIADEINDIIITLICMANSHGIDLNEAMERTMQKIKERDTERFEAKN
ncbi:MAG: nucleotide pyrophosphohydrolase [Nanoarchaeota archaeon]|nr:nucleotide pyrophosphohydrolase [Nanoarchaeota archaeon]MBU1445134.1 nucleotide pyrophosphohydrolase [Nanoarchaeota archaeon]MBU2420080.1 nucleotide pyrophosphohydrolase [Nanoarchaeota archaeon]MBU2475561.1 nucleotide pyrophosphohydrolase [Nanoarchaeota archaeon]MBU3940740.1 nucleotide pyrophosphohydrolase [Nanoarchaeota archaeon]